MNSDTTSDTTQWPCFVIEVHRYELPVDKFRFFHFQSEEVGNSIALGAVIGHDVEYYATPFGKDNPRYAEIGRQQVTSEPAAEQRNMLTTLGYVPMTMEQMDEVNPDLTHWAIHTHCPIEFHQQLDQRDPDWTPFVTFWVRSVRS